MNDKNFNTQVKAALNSERIRSGISKENYLFHKSLDHSTNLFRHLATLDDLCTLLEQKKQNKEIALPFYVSSYGCSTGQELFSLLMILDSVFGKNSLSSIEACGYDISAIEIEIASSGRIPYGNGFGVTDYPELILEQRKLTDTGSRSYDARADFGIKKGIIFSDYISACKDEMIIGEDLLGAIKFKVQDITQEFSETPQRDLIVAMALMYNFSENGVVCALRNMDRNLKKGGILVVPGNDGVADLIRNSKRYDRLSGTIYEKIKNKSTE